MSYLALYRKYRPQTFSEIVGQKNILKILMNSITNDMFSHAYLFSGPRGTGKTTFAKLIAKVVNCSNKNDLNCCDKCPSCIAYNNKNNPDIIEIDAASNNGVDEIREIRDKVNLMPSISKYKVYIIDEVHMLSIGAFNALLKTLEEPPEHVIFILATTEFYKVPETIISRCQCFNFDKISEKDIVDKLDEIVDKEKLKVDQDVLKLIAKYSNGGLRDAINMLDKLICISSKVTIDDFYEIRGLIKEEDINETINYLFNENINELIDKIEDLDNKGKNLFIFAEELMSYLKDLLIKNLKDNSSINNENFIYNSIEIINTTIINMKNSSFYKILLEVAMIKIINANKQEKINTEKTKEHLFEKNAKEIENSSEIVKPINLIKDQSIYVEDGKIKFEESKQIETKISKLKELIEQNRKIRINNTFATADKNLLEELKNNWKNISEYAYDKEYSSICSYLIDGTVKVAGKDYIIVSVAYSSVLKNALVNINKIEKLLQEVTKNYYKIAFILETEWETLKQKYIEDKKSGIEYKLEEEKAVDYDIMKEEVLDKEKSAIVKTAENLFGNDLIEVK